MLSNLVPQILDAQILAPTEPSTLATGMRGAAADGAHDEANEAEKAGEDGRSDVGGAGRRA